MIMAFFAYSKVTTKTELPIATFEEQQINIGINGTWVNTDPNTKDITKVIISKNGSQIQAYGKCHPRDCDWKTTALKTYKDPLWGGRNGYRAFYDQGFGTRTISILQIGGQKIVLRLSTKYKDKRPDRTSTYYMIKTTHSNQTTLREDCVRFNPNTIRIKNSRIVDGNHSIMSFQNYAEAKKVYHIIKKYNLNQYCFVGRPNPSFTYLLKDGKSPVGKFQGEDCIGFSPSKIYLKREGSQYLMTDGRSRMFMFPNKAEAEATLSVIKKYGFTKTCYVGRPNPSLQYMRKGTNNNSNGNSASDVKTGYIQLPMTKNKQNISYEIENNLTIFQGDIVLGERGQVAPRPKQHPKVPDYNKLYNKSNQPNIGMSTNPLLAVSNNGCLWFYGIVPYALDSDWSSTEKNKIINAIRELDQKTNLTFVPKNGQRDYIYFKKVPGMNGGSSPIGRQGRKNTIRLGTTSKSVVIHEILHSVGFYHEQARSDRDKHVEIIWNNIPSGKKHNFKIHNSDGFKIGNYDKKSIMHYHGRAWGINNQPTIIDLQTQQPVQYSSGLSLQDIDGVNFMYPKDYGNLITPPLNVLRTLKTTIKKVEVIKGEDGCGTVEFYTRMEAGPQWYWKAGNSRNTTERMKTNTIKGRLIRPNWQFRYPLQANSQKAKVHIRLMEEDGGFCFSDDHCDINPINELRDISLLIDTGTGEIWLSGINETTPLHYAGQVGSDIILEGYGSHSGDDTIRANITLRIDLT